MNLKQKDELAKQLWDLSKITYAVLVVGLIAQKENFNSLGFTGGVIGTLWFAFAALYLRKKRKK